MAEAARYALLRRLAPALGHNLAGALQPLGMISAMLELRLQKPNPDLTALALKSKQLNTLTREASSYCTNQMTWLAPKNSDLVTVAAGIEDAAGLVMNELSFKGFRLVNQTGDMQAILQLSLIRSVFIAALMALTDAATAPANVVLATQFVGSELVLTISIHPVQGELLAGSSPFYRNIEWEDVQALAELESVRIVHTPDRAELHCPVTILTI